MTREELEKHWCDLLDAHNAKPDDDPRTVYRCRRCGGTFGRKPSANPPKCCPACGCERWLDPEAVYRFKAWSRKPHGG